MRKSSSFFGDLSCAVKQRGCFPRPTHWRDPRRRVLSPSHVSSRLIFPKSLRRHGISLSHSASHETFGCLTGVSPSNISWESREMGLRLGNDECADATGRSVEAIRDAIESDRRSGRPDFRARSGVS